MRLLWLALAAWCLLLSVSAFAVQQPFEQGTLANFLASTSKVAPFRIPIQVRTCVINKSSIKLDEDQITKTLDAIQSTRVPQYEKEKETMEGIAYEFSYTVLSGDECELNSDLVLTVDLGVGRKEQDQTFIRGERSYGIIRAGSQVGSGELAGRVAGWIVSAVNAFLAPNLSRKLFFSLIEDDGAEVSIVGFHRALDTFNPLFGLDLHAITEQLRDWIGMDHNKTIVKATTRDVDDHPAVLTALLRSRQSHVAESYDPATGRFSSLSSSGNQVIDPDEFIRGVSESSDSLFRAGSAARLVRLRRREVEVYALLGHEIGEMFRDGTNLHASGTDIAILVPPNHGGRFNLTTHVLFGLADSLGGISTLRDGLKRKEPKKSNEGGGNPERKEQLPQWLSERAKRNVALNELSRMLSFIRESMRVVHPTDADFAGIVKDLERVRSELQHGDWIRVSKTLRGDLRDKTRSLVRLAKSESRRCCEKRLVVPDRETRSSKRVLLMVVYAVVGFVCFCVFGSLLWLSRNSKPHTRTDVKSLFGRLHLD